MNVAVINLKDILKYFFRILIATFIIFITTHYISNSGQNLKKILSTNISTDFLIKCLEMSITSLKTTETDFKTEIKISKLMNMELAVLGQEVPEASQTTIANNNETPETSETQNETEYTVSPQVEIPKQAETEEVSDRNFKPGSNTYYGTTAIDNESDYTLTEEMLVPDVELDNKKDIMCKLKHSYVFLYIKITSCTYHYYCHNQLTDYHSFLG